MLSRWPVNLLRVVRGDDGRGPGQPRQGRELVSHYRLRDKPGRAFEALWIFLHRAADEACAELRAGRAFVVRRGERGELEALHSVMRAQGFVLRLRRADRD